MKRFDSDQRASLKFAALEARELGHPTVGPEHLLLGILGNARTAAAQLLATHGVTLPAARAAVVAAHAADTESDAATESDQDPSAAGFADTSAVDADREALKAIGIDLDAVRDAVRRAFGDDITEGWGERRGRSGRGGRGRRGDYGPRHPGHAGHPGRGFDRDCGPREFPGGPGPFGRPGFGPRGFGPGGFGPGGPGGWGPRGDFAGGFGPYDDPRLAAEYAQFGPGRGRRGPRRNRFTPAAAQVLRTVVAQSIATDQHSFSAELTLLALLDAGDPIVTTILENVDTAVLRTELQDTLGAAPA